MIEGKIKREIKREALALGILSALVAAMLFANPAHAATFNVNSTGDGGDDNPGNGTCAVDTLPVGFESECTLRAAIEETNANNNDATVVDDINFDIPTTGVATISPSTFLPIITEPVVIDGYTQGDATENTLAVGNNADLRIRLDGASAQGLSPGLIITADDCVVRGLSITNFPGDGLVAAAADNNTIEGNFIGVTPSGADLGNGNGIFIRNGASGNTVGGTTPQARNVISGNGPSSSSSATGVAISDSTTTNNKVMGNYIGTTKSGTGDMGNTGRGIFVGNGTFRNIIGDDNPADGLTNAANVIAFNGLVGVDVSGNGATGNRILSNSIFSNDRLGIDLGGLNGPTLNDPGDTDPGANNLQNFPVLSSAVVSGNRTTIKGTLDSVPNTTFIIQFFSNAASDPSGFGEGKRFLGQANAATDASGNVSFTFTAPSAGGAVSATATNTFTGDTSEFSREIVKPTITPLSPKPGAKTFKRTVSIQAAVKDNVSDLAKGNIRLFVDGRGIGAFTYNQANDRLSFTARNLSFKRHTVRIIATDGAGNVASRIWSFTVKK